MNFIQRLLREHKPVTRGLGRRVDCTSRLPDGKARLRAVRAVYAHV
jgi:hypothetical protein